jgi:hypothetical protein
MPDRLSAEALVRLAYEAAERVWHPNGDLPEPFAKIPSDERESCEAAVEAVLRGLAEGCDEEGLHQIAEEAELAWIRAHPYPPDAKEPMLLWAVRAVATRLRAEWAVRAELVISMPDASSNDGASHEVRVTAPMVQELVDACLGADVHGEASRYNGYMMEIPLGHWLRIITALEVMNGGPDEGGADGD